MSSFFKFRQREDWTILDMLIPSIDSYFYYYGSASLLVGTDYFISPFYTFSLESYLLLTSGLIFSEDGCCGGISTF